LPYDVGLTVAENPGKNCLAVSMTDNN